MVFRSRIDWWLWMIMVASLAVICLAAVDSTGCYALIIGGGMIVLYIVLIFGCWYEIDGDNLVIYQFFRPTRLPISKIKSVKKTTGYLATAGMSHLRVTITLTDRSILKSSMPIEISPKDRDGFIAALISINTEIKSL